jgi:hypothetical protein
MAEHGNYLIIIFYIGRRTVPQKLVYRILPYRLIGRKIEDKLSDIIIRGSYKENLFITMKNGEIICE